MERQRHTLVLALTLIASTANAQHLYMQVHGTWQQPIGGLSVSNTTTTYGSTNSTTKRESVMLNFGKGPGVGLLVGGRLCGAFSWETRFTFLPGAANKTSSEYTSSSFGTDENEAELSCRVLGVEPALRMNIGDSTGGWYMAVGPSFALMPKLTERNKSTDVDLGPFGYYSTTSDRTSEYTGGIGCGAFGAVGYLHQGSGRVGFFAEINGTARSWAPARYEVIKYTIDGQNELDQLSRSERETEFVNEYSQSSSPDPAQPSKSTKLHLPMSSFGIRAGLHVLIVQ